jgi:2-methylcitrate dehydratase PrpD
LITEKLAHFIHETSPDDIPSEAFRTARLAVTDFMGVALAGSREGAGDIIAEYIKGMGGAAQSGVIGKGVKVPPHPAALANGTMGHALDYDDFSFLFAGHSSVSLAPAILAVGEAVDASGKDILAAYVVGFETTVCISAGVAHEMAMRGWHTTNAIGTMAATAAIARLLKLDPDQTRMAFGIAASMAGGLRQNFGTMTKPLHAGVSAANGVLAATLAQKGFTADKNIIEAPLGFAKVFECDQAVDWKKASADFGKKYSIVSPGINFKPYPSCGGTIGIIDAAIHLHQHHDMPPSMVDEIELGISPFEVQNLIHHRPKTGLEAKFSLEYCACRALLDGRISLSSFSRKAVNNAQVQRLIERTRLNECYATPHLGVEGGGKLNPQSVTVKLKDGTQFSHETLDCKGTPGNPMSNEGFKEKYYDCASLVLDEKAINKSFDMLTKFENLESIRELMELCVYP